MSAVTSSMLSAIDARLRQMVFEGASSIPIISDKIVKKRTTDRAYEIINRFVGVDEAAVVGENTVFPEKDVKQDTSKTVSIKKFGFVINASRELIVDNMFEPIMEVVAKAMRNSMTQTKERRIINLFNNGFTTQTTQDGLSLFNTAHTLVQGGTQSNRAAAASALDLDSLWSAINTMKTTSGNSTLYDTIYDPRFLVVPQALERRAKELVESEWAPQTTENQINVVRSHYPFTVLTSPLLSSTTAWFLVANPSDVLEYGVCLWQREPLSISALFDVRGDTEVGNSVDRDVYSWKARERYECDTVHWLGTYGNAGA